MAPQVDKQESPGVPGEPVDDAPGGPREDWDLCSTPFLRRSDLLVLRLASSSTLRHVDDCVLREVSRARTMHDA
eukprot:3020218-Pyramimonas_sp.AAC.1